MNFSLQSGTVPAIWKMSLTLRPISILPSASKFLEKVVKHQIVQFLFVGNVLPKFHSGFRSQYGYATALLRITSHIAAAFDQSFCYPFVFIDVTKVFNILVLRVIYREDNRCQIGGYWWSVEVWLERCIESGSTRIYSWSTYFHIFHRRSCTSDISL